jgi:serine/threonine-protein kinase
VWWALGFVALALVAGGITYAIVRESDEADLAGSTDTRVDDSEVVASQPDSTATGASTGPTSSSSPVASTTTPTAPPDPLSVLELTRAGDAAVVESLVGQWVPQVSAKRPGIEDDGIVYQLADIVALHQQLATLHGAVLLFSGDYNYLSGDLWVSIVPRGSPTPEGALQFCIDQGIGRDDCFAKFITHDLSITDTVELQP